MYRIKRKIYVWVMVIWVLIGVLWGENKNILVMAADEPQESQLYAQAAVLMDAATGRVLYEKNGQEPLAMASTTKIMTCIIALENADLEEWVDISAYATSMPKVKLYVKKGERYRLEDLLYSLMLESHNDAAVAIAEHIGKELLTKELREKSISDYSKQESELAVAAFAELMNEKAQQLGCENTWFITPNGLDATETFQTQDGTVFVKNHETTATELATIMSYCVLHSPKKEAFLRITQTISHTLTSEQGRNSFCTNHNAFLGMMEGAISGKTGFTNKAGYCYVGALEHEGKTYVVALLACGWPNNKSYKWSDTKKLMNFGIEEFIYTTFDMEKKWEWIPEKILVENGQTDILGQKAYVGVEVIQAEETECVFGEPAGILLKEGEKIEVKCRVDDVLHAPVNKGDVIGCITYEVDGKIYKQEDIILSAGLEEIDLQWCVERILQDFFMF